ASRATSAARSTSRARTRPASARSSSSSSTSGSGDVRGLLAWGAYVPYARLDRKAIGAALGAAAGGRTRAVASYDEDTTPMGAGGGDERDGGDAAAAFLFGDGPVVSEALGHASQTAEFLERWRVPGEPASRQWEERFGEHAYVPLGEAALAEALKQAGVTAPSIDVLIVAGPHARSNKRVAASAGVKKEAIADDLAASVGHTGAAHAGLMLAAALDAARPEQVIAVVSLADGA